MDTPANVEHVVVAMKPSFFWIGGFAWLLIMQALDRAPRVEGGFPASVVWKQGDDPAWAEPAADETGWERIPLQAIPLHTGPFWLRFRLNLPARAAAPTSTHRFSWITRAHERARGPIDGLFVQSALPFELFWDGRRLAQGGVVGADRATEELGRIDQLVRIPDALSVGGPHVVAMRLSSHHFDHLPADFGPRLELVAYASRIIEETRRPILLLAGLGCSVLIAAVCVVVFDLSERRSVLKLSLALCGALALYCALGAIRWIYHVPYNWLVIGTDVASVTIAVISGLVPWLLAEQFRIRYRHRFLVLVTVILAAECVALLSYNMRALWLSRTMLLAALGVAVWAAQQGRAGGWALAACLLLRLFVVKPDESVFGSPTAFIVVGALLLFICRTLAAEGRENREKARQASLSAARLECELLKKNIQPHFLMNTLATIIEEVEQDPRRAVVLIEALANEFRILARVSGEKLISLKQELDLCRSHLRVMCLRRSMTCSLSAAGVNEAADVPPGLFHTLVESGITHQIPRNGKLNFTLDGTRERGTARYILTAHGQTPAPRGDVVDGTGLRYVKARLEESFAGRWSLHAGAVSEGWRTVIEIRPASLSHESAYR